MTISASNRLSAQHPQYQYPPSRNPYWAKVNELKGRVFSDNNTELYRGLWRQRFADSARHPARELHVEIGCNGGHVILEWAAQNPKNAYIGLDWKFKQIFRGAEKSIKRELQNLIFFRAHAERLQFMFAPGEVDHLYLFFPDPWPKNSDWKNRFISVENLRIISKIIKPEGEVHIKTDHAGYFEWMENAIHQTRDLWKIIDRSTDLHKDHPNPASLTIPKVTLFERVFIREGIKINSLKLRALSAQP
jgi:tRNA (guanine-N7-)-methyltransferase